MNRDHILSHLREAAEELDGTVREMEANPGYDVGELWVAMQHLYHHLNTAWNARDLPPERTATPTEEDSRSWRGFPADLDLGPRGPLLVMVAGPYRSGARTAEERAANLRRLNAAAHALFLRGHLPVVGVNMALPIIAAAGEEHYDRIMMPLSLAAADRCDAIVRVGGPSAGADREVERVRARGGAVYARPEDVPPAR